MEWLHTLVLVASILVGFVGIVLFFVERKEKIRFKAVLEAEAISTYKATAMLLGNAQAAIIALQNNDSSTARQFIGQTEGQAQILFEGTIKSLWLNRGYNRNDIERWVKDGVIIEDHVRAFAAYLSEGRAEGSGP